MHFQCRSFIGRTSDNSWSQYWENEPDDPTVFLQRGHLFGLISLKSTTIATPLTQLGHDLVNSITANYFSSEFVSIDTNLQSAIGSITLPDDTRCTIIVLVIHDHQLYAAISGNGTIHLLRQSKIANILENYNHEVKQITGHLQTGDTLFMAANDFIKEITFDALKSSLDSSKLQTIEENLLSHLYSSGADAGSSAALIQIFDDLETSKTSIAPTPVFTTPPQPQISLNPYPLTSVTRRKKTNLFIAVLLLLGLSVSIYLGYQKRQLHQKEQQFSEIKSQLENKLKDASTVKNLNLETAQNLAKESQDLLSQIESIGLDNSGLENYRQQITDILSETGSPDSSRIKNFYELNLIIDNPSYSQISIKDGKMYLVDTSHGRIDILNLSQKSHETFSTESQIKNSSGFVLGENGVYLFDSNTISLLTTKNVKVAYDLTKLGSDYDIKAYGLWNGALYLLDSGNQTIWKLTPNSSGFSKANWLSADTKIPSGTSSLAINGKIWTLSSAGQITPFLRGIKETFPPTAGLNTTTATGLVTTPEGNYLAFFDDSQMVYVFRKDGGTQSRFNFSDKKILDLAFSQDSSAIYVLCQDQKLYLINL